MTTHLETLSGSNWQNGNERTYRSCSAWSLYGGYPSISMAHKYRCNGSGEDQALCQSSLRQRWPEEQRMGGYTTTGREDFTEREQPTGRSLTRVNLSSYSTKGVRGWAPLVGKVTVSTLSMMRSKSHVIITVGLTSEEVLMECKRGHALVITVVLILVIIKRKFQVGVTRVCIGCQMIKS